MKSIESINLRGKKLLLPTFFPDATRGVIRSLDSKDLLDAKIEGLTVNSYHLLSEPGPSVIKSLKGIKGFMNWDGWIITDSGGFQIFSLIQKNKSLGKITKDGVTFHLSSKGGRKKYKITPEKSIQIQFDLGSDIMVCLDYFTPYKADKDEIKRSIETTTEWAKRCKEEFELQCKARKLTGSNKPILIGAVQGDRDIDARVKSARDLVKVGVDGFGLGGWLMDNENLELDLNVIETVAKEIPDGKLGYGLGVGNPQGMVDCIKLNFHLFDCVLPTRDARHKRLYVFSKDTNSIKNIFKEEKWYEYLYISREKYVRDGAPVSQYCDCFTCKNYSRAYLSHLFNIEDSLAFRLATIHNLRFYSKTIELCREAQKAV